MLCTGINTTVSVIIIAREGRTAYRTVRTYIFNRYLKFTCFSYYSDVVITANNMVPNSSDLSPLNYQAWVKCWSLITSYSQSQKQFPSLLMHFS